MNIENENSLLISNDEIKIDSSNLSPLPSLGMVDGVFIPVMLSIWGVILFLRLGVLVGQAGFLGVWGIFSFSYTLTTITIITMSAIVTNGKVKGGGVYYFISRSLGPELGGSIGFIYTIALITLTALHTVGFVEALVGVFPADWPEWTRGAWMRFGYGAFTLLCLTIICLFGAELFAKTSFMIFLMLAVSLITVVISLLFQTPGTELGFTGFNLETFTENMVTKWQKDFDNPTETFSLQYAFGILFPACTGIMVGANMSGDLKKPDRDIPTGTFLANLVTYVSYIGIALIFAFTCRKQTLVENSTIMMKVAFVPHFITMGVFSAALSSALGTIVGSARILHALAKDEIIPLIGFFKVGSGSNDEPRRAIIFIFLASMVVVGVGEINSIAPIITVLITLCYGFVNFSCFFLSITGAPNFRPTFKIYTWYVALFGGCMCIFSMFYVSPFYALLAFSIQIILIVVIYFYAPKLSWGDFSEALVYHQVRKYLLRLESKKQHIKNWRLQVLLLVSNPRTSLRLMDFVNSMKKGGLFLVGNVQVGTYRGLRETLSNNYDSFLQLFNLINIKAFPDITFGESVQNGIQHLVNNSGIGGMKPNTVIIGFYDIDEKPRQNAIVGYSNKTTELIKQNLEDFSEVRDEENPSLNTVEYVEILKDIQLAKKHLVIARNFYQLNKTEQKPSTILKYLANDILRQKQKHIDIWVFSLEEWGIQESYQHLMFQLGYLLHQSSDYQRFHKLRLLSVVDDQESKFDEEERLKDISLKARISAEVIAFCLNERNENEFMNSLSFKQKKTDAKCFCGKKEIENIKKYKILNEIIKKASQETSVLFLTLPPLPNTIESNADQYLKEISILTDKLPPSLLVHGNESVISLDF